MLILDIDNTILPSKEAYDFSLECLVKFWKKKGLGSKDSFYELFNQARQQKKKDLKGHSSNRLRILYFKKMMEYKFGLLTQAHLKLILKLEDEYFSSFQKYLKKYFKQHKESYKKIFYLLNDISHKQKFIFLSNENLRTQIIKLHDVFPKDFQFQILVSEELGVEKPSPQIFIEACRRLDSIPEHCIMIGDNLEDDIEGASKLGMRTIYLKEMFGESGVDSNPDSNKSNSTSAKNLISALEYYMVIDPE